MGDRQADPAGFKRSIAGQPGRPLSGSASPRTARLDQVGLARHRWGKGCEVLYPDPRGPNSIAKRTGPMAASLERRRARDPNGDARMKRFYDICGLRLRTLFGKVRVERELDRELSFHLERQVEENLSRGMSLDDARATARRSLGGVAQIQEECRDMRRTNHIETVWNDLRYAV